MKNKTSIVQKLPATPKPSSKETQGIDAEHKKTPDGESNESDKTTKKQ